MNGPTEIVCRVIIIVTASRQVRLEPNLDRCFARAAARISEAQRSPADCLLGANRSTQHLKLLLREIYEDHANRNAEAGGVNRPKCGFLPLLNFNSCSVVR